MGTGRFGGVTGFSYFHSIIWLVIWVKLSKGKRLSRRGYKLEKASVNTKKPDTSPILEGPKITSKKDKRRSGKSE